MEPLFSRPFGGFDEEPLRKTHFDHQDWVALEFSWVDPFGRLWARAWHLPFDFFAPALDVHRQCLRPLTRSRCAADLAREIETQLGCAMDDLADRQGREILNGTDVDQVDAALSPASWISLARVCVAIEADAVDPHQIASWIDQGLRKRFPRLAPMSPLFKLESRVFDRAHIDCHGALIGAARAAMEAQALDGASARAVPGASAARL